MRCVSVFESYLKRLFYEISANEMKAETVDPLIWMARNSFRPITALVIPKSWNGQTSWTEHPKKMVSITIKFSHFPEYALILNLFRPATQWSRSTSRELPNNEKTTFGESTKLLRFTAWNQQKDLCIHLLEAPARSSKFCVSWWV